MDFVDFIWVLFFSCATFIFVVAKICEAPREYLSTKVSKMFECGLCLGFHVGFWGSVIFGLCPGEWAKKIPVGIAYGVFVSVLSYFMELVSDVLERFAEK